MITAVYPGSFDPCTNGHIDVILRASAIFDRLVVVVSDNSEKKYAFSPEERVDLLKRCTSHMKNVEIHSHGGLIADYVKKLGAKVIIKGLRTNSDFEYEFQIAHVNNRLDSDAETLFMVTNLNNIYLSSSVVRELASRGASISGMVPECIEKDIVLKFKGGLI